MSRTEDVPSCPVHPDTCPGHGLLRGCSGEGGPRALKPGPVAGDSKRLSSWPRKSTQTRWGQGPREPRAVAHQREKPDGVRGPVSPGLLPTRGRSRNVSLPVGVKPQSWRPCRVREQPRHQERRTETPQAGGRQAQPLPRGPREADASEQTHRDCKGGPTGRLGRGGTANSWCCSGNFL